MGLPSHKRNFQTLINNKSIWEYVIPSKNKVQSVSIIEQEDARLFCNLTIEQFTNLPGTNQWASEETSIGVYDSKSDVLCYFRSKKLVEAIINDLNIKEINKKK